MADRFTDIASTSALGVPEAGTLCLSASAADWIETGAPGFDAKPLLVTPDGLKMSLIRMAPGARSRTHSHDVVEQIYVLEGEFSDDARSYAAGDFIVRAPGAPHATYCENGSVALVTYLPPAR